MYAALPGNLTVLQNLRFFSMIYDVADADERIEQLLTAFQLQELRHTRCGLLSSGEKTRLALMKVLRIARGCCCSTSPPPRLTSSAAGADP